MSEANIQVIENRLDRLEAVMSSAGDILLNASQLAQQNARQIERLEQFAEQSAQLSQHIGQMTSQNFQHIQRIEQIVEQNSQQIQRLEHVAAENSQALAALTQQAAIDRVEFREFQRTTQAALARIDRLLDYLIQRDHPRPDNQA